MNNLLNNGNMQIAFTKMHGCGNDYIYVNAMHHKIDNPSRVATFVSDRHKGIGSDGLVLIDQVDMPEADFSMRIFNADGGEAMMCGNASRCIGKYLYERGLTNKTEIRLLTLSGIKLLWLKTKDGAVESVTVDMGEPVFDNPFLFNPSMSASGDVALPTSGIEGEALFVSMGNPHYVVFTDDVEQVGTTGPVLEHHPAFPQRCNIEFARVEKKDTIRTRVWERGSGITMACGTGACATAVAAALTGRASRRSQIVMDGGTLLIEWSASDHTVDGHVYQQNHVYMTGPATFVFDGEIVL